MNRNRELQLKKLTDALDIHFKDLSHLDISLTHRSFVNESKDQNVKHNERYEFLGDAVLELIISTHLFNTYPEKAEGDLTSFRAATVKTDTLASVATKLELGEYLQMSRGEEATGGRKKEYLLANAFESLLGAIYLDQGYGVVEKFVLTILLPVLEQIIENGLYLDAKTQFQEKAQSFYRITPNYRLIEEIGPDHEKTFVMGVYLNDREFGRGEGTSKQKAEEKAAQKALESLKDQESALRVA